MIIEVQNVSHIIPKCQNLCIQLQLFIAIFVYLFVYACFFSFCCDFIRRMKTNILVWPLLRYYYVGPIIIFLSFVYVRQLILPLLQPVIKQSLNDQRQCFSAADRADYWDQNCFDTNALEYGASARCPATISKQYSRKTTIFAKDNTEFNVKDTKWS